MSSTGRFPPCFSHSATRSPISTPKSARDNGEFGISFDHMALEVQNPGMEGIYLVDVGFGDSFSASNIPSRGSRANGRAAYLQNSEERSRGYSWKEKDPERDFEACYRFDTRPQKLIAFESACRYHQSSPESSFTTRLICTIAEPEGARTTLSDNRLIRTTRSRHRDETLLEDEQAFVDSLIGSFGFLATQAEACRPLFSHAVMRTAKNPLRTRPGDPC